MAARRKCATIGQVLQDNGYATMWLGKNHNVPVEDLSPAGSRSEWPLSKGFDRFYGFLGGETNQWYPDLIEDNHAIEPPYTPERAATCPRTSPTRRSDVAGPAVRRPVKPWFMWFCLGPTAPHHAPQEYIDKYKGVFDDGYEAYREWVLARMIERGVVPGHRADPLNPMPDDVANRPTTCGRGRTQRRREEAVRPEWPRCSPVSPEYTDVQVGRIVDFLERTGQLDNTMIFYCADNGASGEARPTVR